MPTDKPRPNDPTLLETSATLNASLWMTEAGEPMVDDLQLLRQSVSWRILHVYVYGTLLIVALLLISLWLPRFAPLYEGIHLMTTAMVIQTLWFTCGINWGVGLRYAAVSHQMPVFQFLWAPVPAYAAWPCLLLPTPWFLVAMALLHGWAYYVERPMWASAGLSPWIPLRRQFTVSIMVLSLIGALSFQYGPNAQAHASAEAAAQAPPVPAQAVQPAQAASAN